MPSNLYCRGGVWYARIQVDGSDDRRSLKTRNRKEAERRLKAFLVSRSPYHGTIRRTFAGVALAWSEECLDDKKPSTQRRYASSLEMLRLAFGSLWWDQVDHAAVKKFIADRKSANRTNATIKRDLDVLAAIADHADADFPAAINPVTRARRSIVEKTPVYVRPPPADIDLMISCCHGRFRDLARFALETGVRLEEATELLWANVDEKIRSATLYVTKTDRVRGAGLSDQALAILRSLPRSGPYVFANRNGTPYLSGSSAWRSAVERAQKQAQKQRRKLVVCRFHDLRHEFAIRYLESGGRTDPLRLQLGHSSVRQTEEYLRYLPPELQETAKSAPAQK